MNSKNRRTWFGPDNSSSSVQCWVRGQPCTRSSAHTDCVPRDLLSGRVRSPFEAAEGPPQVLSCCAFRFLSERPSRSGEKNDGLPRTRCITRRDLPWITRPAVRDPEVTCTTADLCTQLCTRTQIRTRDWNNRGFKMKTRGGIRQRDEATAGRKDTARRDRHSDVVCNQWQFFWLWGWGASHSMHEPTCPHTPTIALLFFLRTTIVSLKSPRTADVRWRRRPRISCRRSSPSW